MLKLKPHEADQLVSLIIRTARPRTPDEAAEVDRWVRRLQAGAR